MPNEQNDRVRLLLDLLGPSSDARWPAQAVGDVLEALARFTVLVTDTAEDARASASIIADAFPKIVAGVIADADDIYRARAAFFANPSIRVN